MLQQTDKYVVLLENNERHTNFGIGKGVEGVGNGYLGALTWWREDGGDAPN
jgi:hypothetical protein